MRTQYRLVSIPTCERIDGRRIGNFLFVIQDLFPIFLLLPVFDEWTPACVPEEGAAELRRALNKIEAGLVG